MTVHAVARHTSLGSAAVAAHLEADQALALAELLLAELSSISLGFPKHLEELKCEARKQRSIMAVTLECCIIVRRLSTCETSLGHLCNNHHP